MGVFCARFYRRAPEARGEDSYNSPSLPIQFFATGAVALVSFAEAKVGVAPGLSLALALVFFWASLALGLVVAARTVAGVARGTIWE